MFRSNREQKFMKALFKTTNLVQKTEKNMHFKVRILNGQWQ